jgi:membrane associated rhomboid family serine protease
VYLRPHFGEFHVPCDALLVLWLAQQAVGLALTGSGGAAGVAHLAHLFGFALGAAGAALAARARRSTVPA